MDHKLIVAFIVAGILIAAGVADQKPKSDGSEPLLGLSDLTYSELHSDVILKIQSRIGFAHGSLHTRKTVDLNGLYDFCLDPNKDGFKNLWYKKTIRQSCHQDNFYRIPVPSAFNEITSNNTVRNYIGWTWYQTIVRRDLEVSSAGYKEQEWYVHFESVNYMALVWATPSQDTNSSHFLGAHVGGYLPFSLKFPSSGQEYLLTIAVSNLLNDDTIPSGQMLNYTKAVGHNYYKFQPDFDFFHYSGIMGSVKLLKLREVHIENIEWMSSCSEIKYNIWVSQTINASLKLDFTLKTVESKIIYSDRKTLYSSRMSFHEELTRNLQEFAWNLADKFPTLLVANFVLRIRDQVLDEYEIKVGLRCNFELDFEGRGLLVSGKPRQLQGFGMHHEQYFSGRTMSRAAIMKDLYLLKDMGANIIRTSHYPYSPEFLEACDEVGILVVAEVQAVGLKSFSDNKLLLHKVLITEMMKRDQHHPSIVMWSIANEPQSQLPQAESYFKRLREYIDSNLTRFTKSPDRPITAAIAQPYTIDRVGQFLDVIMINTYQAWYEHTGVLEAIELPLLEILKGWSRKHQHKPLMISEFGADCVAGLHQNEMGLFSEDYQRDLLLTHEAIFDRVFANNSRLNSEINLFLGAMIWNFADFDTHSSLLRVGGNKKGIFTKDRQPKESVKYLKEVFNQRNRA